MSRESSWIFCGAAAFSHQTRAFGGIREAGRDGGAGSFFGFQGGESPTVQRHLIFVAPLTLLSHGYENAGVIHKSASDLDPAPSTLLQPACGRRATLFSVYGGSVSRRSVLFWRRGAAGNGAMAISQWILRTNATGHSSVQLVGLYKAWITI